MLNTNPDETRLFFLLYAFYSFYFRFVLPSSLHLKIVEN